MDKILAFSLIIVGVALLIEAILTPGLQVISSLVSGFLIGAGLIGLFEKD